MTEAIPHNRNRLGVVIGAIFHPFVVFIPALILVLKDATLREAVGWIALIAAALLIPALVLIRRARKQEKYTYQRSTRHQLYIAGELSVVSCATLAVLLDAPERLVFSLLSLCIWIPLQYTVNARLTKISAHTAVISGIVTALILMGEFRHPLLFAGAISVVLATAWARIVTGHHTRQQVALGISVSIVAVFAAYSVTYLM